jgi:hypothetical protein
MATSPRNVEANLASIRAAIQAVREDPRNVEANIESIRAALARNQEGINYLASRQVDWGIREALESTAAGRAALEMHEKGPKP